jgi:hypothetical protein
VRGEAFAGFERLRLSSSVAHAARSGRTTARVRVARRARATAGPVRSTPRSRFRPLAGRPFAPLDPDYLAALRVRAYDWARRSSRSCARRGPVSPRRASPTGPRASGSARRGARSGGVELSREDVLEGERHRDEVALGSWPIELWEDHRRPRYEYQRGPCSIPLGALVSRARRCSAWRAAVSRDPRGARLAARDRHRARDRRGDRRGRGDRRARAHALASVDPEVVRERILAQADGYSLP